MTSPPKTVTDVIEIDLPCVGCGYNLRTQSMAASCPECGRTVVETWRSKLLHESELGPLRANGLPWLRAMRRGVGLATLAWRLALIGFVYGLIRDPGPPYADDLPAAAVWLAPLIGVWVISHLAVWHLMYARRHRWTLRLGRAAVVLAVAALPLLYLNDRFVYFYQSLLRRPYSYSGTDWTHATVAIGSALMSLWPLIAAGAFGRFVQIAWIAKRRVAAVILALVGAIVSGANALIAYPALVFGIPSVASADLATAMVGPTGTLPFVWTALVYVLREHPRFGGQIETEWVILGIAVICVIYSAAGGLGILLFSLRKTLTRAILLSEESESSSSSSPSPRPPA